MRMRGLLSTSRAGAAGVSLACALVFWPSHGSGADWKEMGPAPIGPGGSTGRVSDVAASPSDPDLIYVGTATGGVWRIDATGPTPLTDDMPSAVIGAIALDPNDESISCAGTGEANYSASCFYGIGIYKSVDAGETWEILGSEEFSGRTISHVAVSPDDSQLVYVALQGTGGMPDKAASRGHPDADGAMGVFRSPDGGQSWEQLLSGLPSGPATDLAMHPADSKIMIATIGEPLGSSDNGVFRSTDGGDSWEEITAGLPATDQLGRMRLEFAPSDGNRVYILASKASLTGKDSSTLGVYRSDDAGLTYTRHDPGNLAGTAGWYYTVVGVDPSDPDLAYFGGLGMVRTRNGGTSFGAVTPPHVDQHAVAFTAAGDLLVGNDGGLTLSPDEGQSWSRLNTGMGTVEFYSGVSISSTDEEWFFAGTQDNGSSYRGSNAADDWVGVLGGDGGYTARHPDNQDVVLGESQYAGALYRSADGGQSFNDAGTGIETSDRNAFMSPIVFDPEDPQTLYYATHRVYRSTNAGQSWTAISDDLTSGPPYAIHALAIAPTNGQVLYVATIDGRLLVSENGGADFDLKLEDVPSNRLVSRQLVGDPRDDNVAYFGVSWFGRDHILRTDDRGDTWTSLDGNYPDIPVNAVSVHHRDEDAFIYLGTDSGLFVSCQGGEVWRVDPGLPRTIISDLVVDTDRDRLVVLTFGRGLWTRSLLDVDDELCEVDQGDGDAGDGDAGDGDAGDGDEGDGDAGDGDGGDGDDGDDDDDAQGDGDGSEGDDSNSDSGQSDGAADDVAGSGCGCATSWGGPAGLGLAVVLGAPFGVAVARRRKRRRRSS